MKIETNARRGAASILLIVSASLAFLPAGASAGFAGAFQLGAGTRATALTAGPDGNLWFTGFTSGWNGNGNVVGRVAPTDGAVGEFSLGSRQDLRIGGIVTGANGALWFADTAAGTIGRAGVDGSITEFPLPAGSSAPMDIVSGADDALWFTEAGNEIGRIDMAAKFSEYSLSPGASPAGIAAGPDGALWITENGLGRIARLAPNGTLTEFPLPDPSSRPAGIVAGPDGALWFAEEGAPRIGRIDTDGVVQEFPVPSSQGTREIVSGPSGNLWFTSGNEIGSISPTGATGGLACVKAGCKYPIASLAAGPERALWYGTGIRETEGGGGSALLELSVPGLVGRFEAPPLAIRFGPGAGRVRGSRTTLQVNCDDGIAGEVCTGRVLLTAKIPRSSPGKARSVVVARRAIEVAPDAGRRIGFRLNKAAADRVSRHGKLAVIATATQAGDPVASRKLTLRSPGHR